MTDERSREETWLTQQLGECPAYEMPREDLLELLMRQAEYVRLEALGEVYCKLEAVQRLILVRNQPGFAAAKDATYEMLTEKQVERVA